MATGLRDGIALGASKLLQAVLAVAALKFVLRVSTEEDYGRYVTFLLVANVAIACTSWPIASVLRLGAEEWLARKKLSATWLLHFLLVAGSFALVGTLAWEAREAIDRYVRVPDTTRFVLLYTALTASGGALAALLKPAGNIVGFALLSTLTRFMQVGALATLALLHRTLDTRELIVLCTVTALPQLVAGGLFALRHVLPPALPAARDAERALHFGLPVLARQISLQAFTYTPLAAVKQIVGDVGAGRFQIGNSLAEQTALLAGAFEDLMGPILARAAAKGEERVLATYYRTLAPQVVLAWATACGAVLVLARPVLAALSAKAVHESAGPFQILLLATAVRIVVTLEAPVFDAHLISRAPLVFFATGIGINIGLNRVLVPANGIEGAAWAAFLGWLVNSVLRSGYLRVRFRVPSLDLYLGLVPVALAFAWTRLAGGNVLVDALAALGLVVLSLLAGKLAGVFSPETLGALEGVRMPGRLRALLAVFYGARKP